MTNKQTENWFWSRISAE